MGDAGPPLLRKRVVINGLKARPELNGSLGDVTDFNEESSRYSVLCQLTGETVALKSSNLQVQTGGEQRAFAIGTKVELHSLVSKPELNGCGGIVKGWDDEAGRFVVMLDGKLTSALYKPANLRTMPASRRATWQPEMPDANAQAQIKENFDQYVREQWKNANPFGGMMEQAQAAGVPVNTGEGGPGAT